MSDNSTRIFPKSRKMIFDAIEEAACDAFGVEPPPDNSRPIQNALAPQPGQNE